MYEHAHVGNTAQNQYFVTIRQITALHQAIHALPLQLV